MVVISQEAQLAAPPEYEGALALSYPSGNVADQSPTLYPVLSIDLTQLDVTAPYLDSYLPTGVEVDPDTLIYLYINDEGNGAEQSTLDVTVDGNDAIIGGIFQSGYDGVGSSIVPNSFGGFVVSIDPTASFGSAKTIVVTVYVEDTSSNALSDGWSFQVADYLGPLVAPTDPQPSEIDVAVGDHIYISITDESGVAAGSVLIEVDRGYGFVVAFEHQGAPEFKEGYDGPASEVTEIVNGYQVVLDPTEDFDVAATVYVRVTALDPTGNEARL
jgi:hypothetical protein